MKRIGAKTIATAALVAVALTACRQPDASSEIGSESTPAHAQKSPGLNGDGGPWLAVGHYGNDAALLALAELVAHYQPLPERRAVRLHVDDLAHWDQLEAAGFSLRVDWEATLPMHAALTRGAGARALAARALAAPAPGIPGFECYRTVDETFATAERLAAENPQLVEWIDIGDSWRKHNGKGGDDLWVIRVTNRDRMGPKPVLFLTASIHARELAPAELVTRFVERLVDDYGQDADATWIIDDHEIHAVLQANPDGRRATEAGTARRKNANDEFCGSSPESLGVDLNRNWPFKFGNRGTSTAPCSQSFRGPEAMSEPESAAYVSYLRTLFPDQRDEAAGDFEPAPDDATGIYLDVHSFGELVMWPYGFTDTPTGNAPAFRALGQRMAYFSEYAPINLLPSSGSTAGTGYGELGIAALGLELGTSFFQSCESFESSVAPINLDSLLYAAKVARTPFQTPFGPDITLLAIDPAEAIAGTPISLTAHADDTRFQERRGSPTLPPIDAVAAIEVYVDTPPWNQGAEPIELIAADGAFDQPIESGAISVATETLAQGRHTLFVRSVDAAGNAGPVSALFLTITDNRPPRVTIETPTAGARVDGVAVDLRASATDPEQGELSASIVWSSSADGELGTGAALTVDLSDGDHVLEAAVADGAGNTARASVAVQVGLPDGGGGGGGGGGGDGGDGGAGGDQPEPGTDSGGCATAPTAAHANGLLVLAGVGLLLRRRRRGLPAS